MVRIKSKSGVLSLIILSMILFMGAEKPKEGIQIFYDNNIEQETGFTFLSVSLSDEVLIGFPSGNVYLYDSNDNFLCRYKFPKTNAYFRVILSENQTIKYYVPRLDKLSIYDRNGNFLEEMVLENKSEREKAGVERSNHISSKGVEYVKKPQKIIKVYSDGSEKLFCELHIPGEDIAAGVILIPICLYMVYKYGKKIFGSKKQYYSS